MTRVNLFSLALLICLVLSACSTLTITFKDQIIPEEQQCKLLIAPNLYVIKFDDEEVYWNSYFRPTVIIIPAGEHTIVSEWRSGDLYVEGSLSVTDDFKAGKNYRLHGIPSDGRITLIVQDVTDISTYKKLFK
jgi:ABC-type microcin C transport system permease subunit YejB